MKKLKILLLAILAMVVLWHFAYPSGIWRYKITVTVETPEGLKTASAVREVRASLHPKVTSEDNPLMRRVKGEAVPVDLGKRGQVFALLNTYQDGTDGAFLIVDRAFPFNGNLRDRVLYYSCLKAGPTLLRPEQYPMLVRFRDPADPKTVENLLELKPCPDARITPNRPLCVAKDHFAEAFGAGVMLKSVTVEMTDEPVTVGVVGKYAPSYNPINEYMQWFNSLPYGDPRKIGPDVLKRGGK